MSQTRIFVSSTCYDLIHIRQALHQHIVEFGHVPVMSEFASFRIDPNLTNLENCQENVRTNADVFVLVIGGRRGTVDPKAGKSIVNLEYEAAVREGLDIFVFVDNAVLNLLPIWERNKDALFTPTVDSNEVLEFISKIRKEQRWTFPFTKEADVAQVLALQLSGQLRELLSKRRSAQFNFLELFKNESQCAVSLVKTQNPYWEYLLTAELLEGRLKICEKRYADIQAGRVLGPHQKLTGRQYLAWISGKFAEMSCVIQKIAFVVEKELMDSWGPVGVPGKPQEIWGSVEELGKAFDALLNVESDVYRTHGPDASEPVKAALLGMTAEIFSVVDQIPPQLRDAVLQASNMAGKGPHVVNIALKFTFSRAEQFQSALIRMQANMKADDWDSM